MAATEYDAYTGGASDRHVLEANTGKGVEDADTNGSSSRAGSRTTSTGPDVDQACEGEHIFRKLVCPQEHHIHKKCMGSRQRWQWQFRGIVEHD